MKLKIRFTTVLLLIVVIFGVICIPSGQRKTYYTYSNVLDKTVVQVDGNDLTLEDLAFYVIYQEQKVEEQAFLYNPKRTGEYWSIRTRDTYVRESAKEATMNLAIHDEIYYQMALAAGVELDAEDETHLSNTQMDFWSDLPEGTLEKTGVSKDVINESMQKAALAEKYQHLLAAMHEADFEAYSASGEGYHNLLKEHVCEVQEDVWERVHFGSITLDH